MREDALLSFPPHRLPGSKLIAQKIERNDGKVAIGGVILLRHSHPGSSLTCPKCSKSTSAPPQSNPSKAPFAAFRWKRSMPCRGRPLRPHCVRIVVLGRIFHLVSYNVLWSFINHFR